MAKGKGGANSGFKISVGLRYDELNQDFVNVEKTISENIQSLNRKSNLIDIQAQINFIGLTDEAKKLEIIQQKLRQQIELQRNKVILYEDVANQSIKLYGAESKNADNAIYAYQRQRLELAKLSQQLNEITAKQNAMPKGDNNSLLAGYKSFKGDIAGAIGNVTSAFTGLKEASQSADGAITKTLEIIGSIPHPIGKAVAALASIPLLIKGIESSLLDMARPAIAAGDSLYVMSRGMQTSVEDMAQLSMISQVTGIDLAEVNSSVRRLSASLTKADEKGNLASRTLQKYGASVKDSNGNLKQGTALVGELAKAFANARALGKGAEFRDAVGGRFWSADFVTFLEDYAGNIDLAGKVVKNGLADPKLAHSVQGEINAMNAQAKQLSGAFSSAFMPVANFIVPHLRQRMGELTSVINENAETIKNVGYRIGEVVDQIGEFTTAVTKATVEVVKFFTASNVPDSAVVAKYLDKENKGYKEFQDQLNKYTKLQLEIEKLNEDLNEAKSTGDNKKVAELTYEIDRLSKKAKDAKLSVRAIFTDKEINSLSEGEKAALKYNKAIGYYGTFEAKKFGDQERILNKILEENTKRLRENERAAKENAVAKQEEVAAAIELIAQESPERIKKYADELSKIQLDLKFGDNKYKKSLAELDEWYRAAMQKASGFEDDWKEKIAVEELYRAKLAKLRQEPAKRAKDLNQETANIEYELTHSAFQKQLRDIDLWKQAQIEKASTAEEVAAIVSNAAIKETQAFEREFDRIKGKTQSLAEKIFEQEHSQKDRDIMKAQKERAQMLKEGIYPQEMIDRWYENELAKISQNARKNKDYRYAPKLDYSQRLIPNVDFYGNLQAAVDKFAQKPTAPTIDFNQPAIEMNQLTDSAGQAATALSQIPAAVADFQQPAMQNVSLDISPTLFQFDLFATAINNASVGLTEFAVSLQDSAAKIDNQNLNQQKNFFADKSKNSLVIPQSPQDRLAEKIKNAAIKFSNKPVADKPVAALAQNIIDITPITQNLAELTRQVGTIAQNFNQQAAQKAAPPVINVNPTISINLGGAYVFDDAMKAQLTDDITENVVNSVTDAVSKAQMQNNFSFND